MGFPEWLTIPVAESGWMGSTLGPRRLGGLCFSTEAIQLDALTRSDLTMRRLMAHGGFVDCVDSGGLYPFVSDADRRLDRHRLDVALSRGRHAAERAKLAGCQTLICLGMATSSESARGGSQGGATTVQAAYDRLHRMDCFEIAALTGALIAGAQMGLQAYPSGIQARLAAEMALALNPGVRDWFIDSPSAIPQPLRIAPIRSITSGIAAVADGDSGYEWTQNGHTHSSTSGLSMPCS
ncbi:MAG: nicotinate-nucleotide--dimethylbenzimidazole phosphoribosyltransferase [Chromatiales bacterium]|nr:nicotinate-nucleotide--dimethylbenzimidazole phosphoribosyltransferase [Chromatiales bacterium]